jgi:hypothetical protein
LTREEEQRVLARVSHLTSHQIADRILATDLAVLLDSLGYYDRRVTWVDKCAENRSDSRASCADKVRHL